MSLEQNNKELMLENRRLKNALENAGSVEKHPFKKFETSNSQDHGRKAQQFKKDKTEIDVENKQLSGRWKDCLRKNALGQKLAV